MDFKNVMKCKLLRDPPHHARQLFLPDEVIVKFAGLKKRFGGCIITNILVVYAFKYAFDINWHA